MAGRRRDQFREKSGDEETGMMRGRRERERRLGSVMKERVRS